MSSIRCRDWGSSKTSQSYPGMVWAVQARRGGEDIPIRAVHGGHLFN